MEKGDIHYIVFTNNGEVLNIESLKNFFRQDVKLIIKRTFIKRTGGQQLYCYYKNQVLDDSFKVVRNNSFKWNKIVCKIEREEYWGEYQDKPNVTGIILEMTIKDHLQRKNIFRFPTLYKDPFKKIKEALELLDRVGTFEGFYEIKKLEEKIENLIIKLEKKRNKK